MSWSDTGSISDYYQVGHCLWVFVYITSPLGLPKTPACTSFLQAQACCLRTSHISLHASLPSVASWLHVAFLVVSEQDWPLLTVPVTVPLPWYLQGHDHNGSCLASALHRPSPSRPAVLGSRWREAGGITYSSLGSSILQHFTVKSHMQELTRP